MKERKFTPLSELKMSDTGNGSIEGHRAVFGELDSGGDIIARGAFKDCIAEYLHSGFSAESHDWDFSKSVGFPVEAKEDEFGWFVKSEFHSTKAAQDVRTIAKERHAAGKQVGFSFGYKADEFQWIEQKDFKDQLPQFIKADRLEENLKKAQAFSRIRILKKVSAIEDSLVTSPMNKLAGATAVKSDAATNADARRTPEKKGMFEDEIEEREESESFLSDILYSAKWQARMRAASDPTFDKRAAFELIFAEFTKRSMDAEFGAEEQGETELDDDIGTMANRSKLSVKGDLRDRLPYAKHAEVVLGAVDAFANTGAALTEMLSDLGNRRKHILERVETKTGATYSGENMAHMQRVHDKIAKVKKDVSAVHADMGALIAKGKPADTTAKSETGKPDLDTATLRMQKLRMEVLALTT